MTSMEPSFGQERLWILDQLEPGQAAYNMPVAWRIDGPLDTSLIERSLNALIAHHEVLRTSFVTEAGAPRQLIHDEWLVRVPVVDLSALPDAERALELGRLQRAEAVTPFDLAKGPVLRATLLRASEREHVLLFTMHHIASDGATMGLLFDQWSALYAAFSRGAPSPLAPLELQYADYAAWHREWMQGEALTAQLTYWKQRLAGAASLELPTDRPRPPTASRRGGRARLELGEPTVTQLRALARRESATPFMVLLAAFKALLGRYSAQEDISVGTPAEGRSRSELEPLAGLFVNTLVMRTDLGGSPSFRELLARVRETALGAYSHQDAPFEKLVEALRPERTRSRNPLFQAMLVFEESGRPALRFPGLSVTELPTDTLTEKFDLTLFLAAGAGGLNATLSYSEELFDPATMQRLLSHFQRLLADALRHPDKRIGELALLSDEERRRLLVDWNATQRPSGRARCIHEAFDEQARRTPDALAVAFADRRLSFRELNERANQLAHALIEAGVGPEVRVGLCLSRSVEQLVAVLAVLKAGGAYVPLDPSYPSERIHHMLADAKARVLVSELKVRATLPPFEVDGQAGRCVLLDAEAEALSLRPAHAPRSAVKPDNVAYVIYTSGSTGKPRGVMVSHASAENLSAALEMRVYPPSNRPLRVSMNGPIAFDTSVKQLLQLLKGHALIIVSEEARLDPARLVDEVRKFELDVLDCTPSHLQALIAAGLLDCARAHPLMLLVGGEAVDAQLWSQLSQAEGIDFVNLYGPTECTVDATSCRVSELPHPSIGRPLPNVRTYVLDANLEPVPVGVRGELFIAGLGVARGYLGRPDVTAERFVPDPHSAVDGARMYRTGDLVRWLADGSLEYVGRADFQVKLRGFRVELAEIEAALLAQPSVQEAVVLAREDAPGQKRLVAYVVNSKGSAFSVDALRAALERGLPSYMVPNAFVLIDALPLTAHGKLDRRALPAPAQLPESASAYTAPRTPLEQRLCALWEAVLGVSQIGIHDNFFALGGHSLLVAAVCSRAGAEGPAFAPPLLYANQTVATLAEALSRAASRPEDPEAFVVPRMGRRPGEELPLSFGEDRLFRIWRFHHRAAASTLSWTGSLVEGPLDLGALDEAFNALMHRHELFWSRYFERPGGELAKTIEPARRTCVRVVDCPSSRDDLGDVAATLLELLALPGDPFGPPPHLSATVVRFGPLRHGLVFHVDHALFDDMSMAIVLDELMDNYDALARGLPLPARAAAPQFADFARWERSRFQGEVLERGRAYWNDYVKGAPHLTQVLPTDHARAPLEERRAKNPVAGGILHEVSVTVPPALHQRLRAVAAKEQVGLSTLTVAACAATLWGWARQPDLLLSFITDIRAQLAGVEGMVGLMVGTSSVLRIDAAGSPTLQQLLHRTKAATDKVLSAPYFPMTPFVYPRMAHDALRVKFNYQRAKAPRRVANLTLSELKTAPVKALFPPRANFLDFDLAIHDRATGFGFHLALSSALWTEQTAHALTAAYLENLRRMVDEPLAVIDS